MNDNIHRPGFRRTAYLLLGLFMVSVIAFLGLGLRTIRRAQRLRKDICNLELGKSTFDDVSRIFPQYEGYIINHDNTPASCSPEGCSYVMFVENPIPRGIHIWPRIAFFAKVRISNNVLRERYLCIAQLKRTRSIEIFVQQSLDSKFKEDTRIVSESMMPRNGVQVSPDDPAQFVRLANHLNQACLVFLGWCSQPKDMLPYLAGKRGTDGTFSDTLPSSPQTNR